MLYIKWRPCHSKWAEKKILTQCSSKGRNENQQDRICLTFDLANLELKHKIVVIKAKRMINTMALYLHAHTRTQHPQPRTHQIVYDVWLLFFHSLANRIECGLVWHGLEMIKFCLANVPSSLLSLPTASSLAVFNLHLNYCPHITTRSEWRWRACGWRHTNSDTAVVLPLILSPIRKSLFLFIRFFFQFFALFPSPPPAFIHLNVKNFFKITTNLIEMKWHHQMA